MALELQDVNPVNLDIYISVTTGTLQARHGTVELAGYGDSVCAHSENATIQVTLNPPTGWTLTASHVDDEGRTIGWAQGTAGPEYEFSEPSTDPLEITLKASATGQADKEKSVHIDAKPGGALPDRS